MKKTNVGGQAVIEGVMMRGSSGLATAVRTPKGNIEIDFQKVVSITKKHKVLNIPFIRGIFILIDSLIIGIKTLNYSASFFEETEPSKFEDWLKGKFGEKSNDIIIGMTMTLSMVIAVVLFMAIPTGVASLFKGFGLTPIALNLIEAVIRIIILIAYIYGISQMEDIFRVFQYHGAEHKTIFCYEAEEELTVENVKKYGRFHPRCGTNFLFLIMMVSVVIFTFTGWGSFIQRLGLRIVLIPIISGITYEIIKWLGKSNSKLAQIISYPGLKLQGLTTREPDDSQIEVAIAALLAAEGLEEPEKTIGELLQFGVEKLKKVEIDTYILDTQLLLGKIIERDRIYLITNRDEKINNKFKKDYLELLNKRVKKMPISYILGETEFMGLDLYVEEGVLIPRADTEVLVEEVLKLISKDKEVKVCDLCCGSGAIGIALAHYRNNINIDLIDYYEVPEKITIKNLNRHNLNKRATFIKSNLLEKPIEDNKKYDLIVSNPPYIKEKVIDTLMDDVKDYEPHTALSGGEDGLCFYKRIIDESKSVLNENGILSFEIGHDQAEELKKLMTDAGFKNIRVIKDLSGLDRVAIGALIVD
ncbi:peptide chain release factor N(5)-glutamine methyltransferase [Clostridium gasigenes]|uniref:peptide chain release factor N(5)-glutamine methyltransferase n=1 Tax=Clostridium gasigenes TaxID=94869 RepID=UPI001C0E82DA|nr:peptide chain release factor N(5)-glutamine methyltransferase [Clostridium gasigenes]MBU3108177.1 peptide chain release factor N(5)-glutamine methyltransferase [Clostridium gasigenes]